MRNLRTNSIIAPFKVSHNTKVAIHSRSWRHRRKVEEETKIWSSYAITSRYINSVDFLFFCCYMLLFVQFEVVQSFPNNVLYIMLSWDTQHPHTFISYTNTQTEAKSPYIALRNFIYENRCNNRLFYRQTIPPSNSIIIYWLFSDTILWLKNFYEWLLGGRYIYFRVYFYVNIKHKNKRLKIENVFLLLFVCKILQEKAKKQTSKSILKRDFYTDFYVRNAYT